MATNKATDETKAKADLLGISYNVNIGDDKLREKIREKMNEGEEPEAPTVVETPKGPQRVVTEEEKVAQRTVELKKEMMALKRVIVSCNDPQMKEWETTPPIAVGNKLVKLPKIVVPLNVEWHIPKAVYDFMKAQKCGISIKAKDGKGRPITKRKKIAKYNIQDLPELDKEELAELKSAQARRDGVGKED